MEDKRITKICSDLDSVARSITTFFYIFIALAVVITGCASVWLTGLKRIVMMSAGVVLVIASFWLSCRSNDCVRIMTQVMRYYTETTKLK